MFISIYCCLKYAKLLCCSTKSPPQRNTNARSWWLTLSLTIHQRTSCFFLLFFAETWQDRYFCKLCFITKLLPSSSHNNTKGKFCVSVTSCAMHSSPTQFTIPEVFVWPQKNAALRWNGQFANVPLPVRQHLEVTSPTIFALQLLH